MKRILIIILLLVMILTSVVGCSSPTPTATPTTQKATPAATTQAPAANLLTNQQFLDMLQLHLPLFAEANELMTTVTSGWRGTADDPSLVGVCEAMMIVTEAWFNIPAERVPEKFEAVYKYYSFAMASYNMSAKTMIESTKEPNETKRVAIMESALEDYDAGNKFINLANDELKKLN